MKGWSPHVTEFKTDLDPGFHIVVSRLQVLDSSLCQWNLDSWFHSVVRFQRAVLPIPEPRIPASTSKNFPDSGIQIPLHLGVTITFQERIQEFWIGGWRGGGGGVQTLVQKGLVELCGKYNTVFIRLTTLGAYQMFGPSEWALIRDECY